MLRILLMVAVSLGSVWVVNRVAGLYAHLIQRGAHANWRVLQQSLLHCFMPHAKSVPMVWSTSLMAGAFMVTGLLYEPFAMSLAPSGGPVFVSMLLWWWVLMMLYLLVAIDARIRLLPDALSYPLLWVGLLLQALTGEMADWLIMLLMLFGGLIAGYGFLLHRYQLVVFGLGDIKLVLALGVWLVDLNQWITLLLYACLGCWAHQIIVQRRLLPRGECAFGPYLVFGFFIAKLGVPAVQFSFNP